jgi:hypothetical protein
LPQFRTCCNRPAVHRKPGRTPRSGKTIFSYPANYARIPARGKRKLHIFGIMHMTDDGTKLWQFWLTLAQFVSPLGKSGRGLPQSKTLARCSVINVNAKRLGLLQPSGALFA